MTRVVRGSIVVTLLLGGVAWAAEPSVDPDPAPPPAEEPEAEVVLITADRRERDVQEVPASVAVVSGDTLRDMAATHLEDVLQLVPNTSWVGASNRPRFLLIRGVGDLGTGNLITNPSVGVLVDEVDLSGMAAALTTLDVERVEVLRGPQGTLFGPNALGGLISFTSRAPTLEPEARAEVRYGSHDTRYIEAAASSRLIPGKDILSARVAASLNHTDGWMQNTTLDRRDTAGRDELATRARIRVQPTDDIRIDLIGSYVDIDDGYDHWSVKNTRETQSDRPGEDSQRTGMGALLFRADVGPVRLESNTSLSTSRWVFDADYDWIAADTPKPPGSTAADDYSTDLYGTQDTVQDTFTQEVRLSSRDGRGPWKDRVRGLGGLYVGGARQQMATGLEVFGEPQDWAANDSDYHRLSAAGFGQVDVDVVEDRLTLTAGGRAEHAWQTYEDALGFEDAQRRWLFGWKLAAFVRVVDALSLYVSGAQSSKLGGFNLAPDVPVQVFLPEVDRSGEVGIRAQDPRGRWKANGTFFYVDRQDQQLSEWVQRPGGDSADIYFYTDNAARAHTLGAEVELAGEPVRGLTLEAALGFLDARIDDWKFATGTDVIDYSGKRHANAPAATFSFAVSYDGTRLAGASGGPFGRVGVTGASKRYLANNNEIEDGAYALLDLRLGWRVRWFGVSVWGRNLTNTEYATTGFGPYFTPNEHYPAQNYFRWGDGAVYGLALEAKL